MLAISLFATDAFAQSASQIAPPSFRPDLGRPGGFALPGAPGLATPRGAEKLHVRLSGVSIKGGLPQLAAETAEIETRLSGRRVTGAEIFAAARDLEAAYARAGYVLVRVILPPQQLVDGARLRLIVIDGFIERVETKDLPERVRRRIATLVEPLTGRRSLTLREIERRVLLAGDTPGVILRSTLAPGRAEGAAILVIEGTYQAVDVPLNFDNTMSKDLGRTNFGAGLDLNSIAGLGELTYLRVAGHPNSGDTGFFERYPKNRILAGGIVVPLWIDGLTFNVEYTDARTAPREKFGLQNTDVFDRLALRLRYAWLRSRSANFNIEGSFDAQSETQRLMFGGLVFPWSLDRLRVFRASADGDTIMPWGATISGRITASFGVDGLGARSIADANPLLPLSRQGADAAFQKLDVSLGYNQPLHQHLILSLTARAQTSFNKPLLNSERIGIANTSALSAFDSGTLVGDQGYVVRGELQSPWSLPQTGALFSNATGRNIGVVMSPYLFAAYGEVMIEDPTILEVSSIRAASYGVGVRFGGAAAGTLSNGSLGLEYGRATRSDNVPAGHRFTIVSSVRF